MKRRQVLAGFLFSRTKIMTKLGVVQNTVPTRTPNFSWSTSNSKELQEGLGLSWYDYGARMYDTKIGRWFAVEHNLLSQD